jgi:carboxyl-terminal processing protease
MRFSLRREVLRVQSVRGRLLESGVAYIATTQFQEATPARLAETIADLRRTNQVPFSGIILDLRWCTGGLLNTAVVLSAAFLPRGMLVFNTRGRSADESRRFSSDASDYLRTGRSDPLVGLPPELKSAPMVVLVGPTTAAGAEIVASALQDQKRAVVIGSRSLGRGTLEMIFPLPGSRALKLTIARVYRPNGEPLDGKGIGPDLIIEAPARADDGIPPDTSPPRGTQLGSPADPAVAEALKVIRSGRRL